MNFIKTTNIYIISITYHSHSKAKALLPDRLFTSGQSRIRGWFSRLESSPRQEFWAAEMKEKRMYQIDAL